MKPEWIESVAARLRPLGLRPEREAEIVDELTQHLDDEIRELIAGGQDPDAAARQALAELDAPGVLAGRLARILKPSPYLLPPGTPSRGRWLSARWLDVRQSVRALSRTPAFTATVVFTLALSIGPTTAMLSIGEWLVWRPVPAVSEPARLGIIYFGEWRKDGRGVSPHFVSPLNVADLVAESRTIEAMAGTQELTVSVTIEGGAADDTPVAHADPNLFSTLGVHPIAGRFFSPEEDLPPYAAPVSVLSAAFARRAFGSPEGALGRTIQLNGRRFSVIGVAPEAFRGVTPFSAVDVWYPGAAYRYVHHFSSIAPTVTRADGTFYEFVFRLRPGATFDAVRAELDVMVPRLAERYPDENESFRTVRARVFPGLGPFVLQRDTYKGMVLRLLLIGGVLLLLGCANVTNLLAFRSVRRERESAVRMALGAGRARLLQLHLTESCLLTLAGAALGIGLAAAMTRFVASLVLPAVAASGLDLSVPIDRRVLLATLGVSVACGLGAGMVPAWISVNRPVTAGLSQAGARGTARGRLLRAGFAVVQLALSLALVVDALLMVTTVRKLGGVDPGFVTEAVSVHFIDLNSQGYTPERAAAYVRGLEADLSSSAGILPAFAYSYPFGSTFGQRISTDGSSEPFDVTTNAVSARYFSALGIPLLKGRTFSAEEALGAGDRNGTGVVVGQSLARRLYGEEEPLGRTLVIPGARNTPPQTLQVIGVVGDVRSDLTGGEPQLTLYQPLTRTPFFVTRPVLLVKSPLPVRAVSEIVRAAAARLDPTVPVSGNQPLRSRTIDRRLSSQRVFAWVLSLLGGLGFVLAAVGLYGLLAQGVTERTREFGIRMAIGATRAQVNRLVLRSAALIAAVGGVAGLGLALLGSRLIEAQLWGVTARDPSIYAAAAAALLAVVFVAAAWPARLATRIEPVEALRAD